MLSKSVKSNKIKNEFPDEMRNEKRENGKTELNKVAYVRKEMIQFSYAVMGHDLIALI